MAIKLFQLITRIPHPNKPGKRLRVATTRVYRGVYEAMIHEEVMTDYYIIYADYSPRKMTERAAKLWHKMLCDPNKARTALPFFTKK